MFNTVKKHTLMAKKTPPLICLSLPKLDTRNRNILNKVENLNKALKLYTKCL